MNLIDIAVAGYKPMPMELRPFNTVLKNERNQLEVITGPTFQNIELITNITDPTKIESVQVELNGGMIVDVTGSDLKMIQDYSKRTRADVRYIIPFTRPEARTLEGMRLGELVTLPSDIVTIYVKLGDTGATAPTLRARAHVTPAQSVRYFVPKMDVVNVNAHAGNAENVFSWPVRSPNLFIRRLHFFSDQLTKMRVYRDDLKIFEATKADNDADLSEGGDNAPQANVFHFDPAHSGFHLQGLFATVARKELAFKFDMQAAGTVRVLRETIEQVQPMGQAA